MRSSLRNSGSDKTPYLDRTPTRTDASTLHAIVQLYTAKVRPKSKLGFVSELTCFIVIKSPCVSWIACRKSNCLNHMKKCPNQTGEKRAAAQAALDEQNSARREVRRTKKMLNKTMNSRDASLPLVNINCTFTGSHFDVSAPRRFFDNPMI